MTITLRCDLRHRQHEDRLGEHEPHEVCYSIDSKRDNGRQAKRTYQKLLTPRTHTSNGKLPTTHNQYNKKEQANAHSKRQTRLKQPFHPSLPPRAQNTGLRQSGSTHKNSTLGISTRTYTPFHPIFPSANQKARFRFDGVVGYHVSLTLAIVVLVH